MALAVLTLKSTMAQELEHRPAQVSVVPGLSTNGINAGSFYQNFSFNLLGGLNGGVKGLELGGIININKQFAKGTQMAGVANWVGGETAGVQMAGVLNRAGGASRTWQMAGVANLNKGSIRNSQWAGVLNVAGANSKGAQLSGVANLVKGNMSGFQAAGVVNIATGEIKGTQLSGIVNQAKQVRGAQVGVINLAGSSKVQVGVINIADSANATFGLINIVRQNGYYRGEVWASETFLANAAFKMGTRKLYTLLAAGWRQKDNTYHLGYGIGFGSEFLTREKTALSLDLITYQLSEDKFWTSEGPNNIHQARLTWARRISGNTAFLLGGTFNVLHSTYRANETEGKIGMDIAPWDVYSKVQRNRLIALWPGVQVGFRF